MSSSPKANLVPAPGMPPILQIGRVTVAPPVLMAPMSGLTNLPMRTLAEEAGCGLTVSEFMAAPALAAGVSKELQKVQPSPGGKIWSAQIFGRDAGQMARAAVICVDAGASLLDINMGCPTRKVTKGVAGAALMREPALAEELLVAVREAVGHRAEVTVKMRVGWDTNSLNAPELAARLVAAGARAITVHGRTAKQGYSGKSDPAAIARVKQAVDVPVIGNGDITDVASCERLFAETGCDGVMIGRAAMGNPWLFTRCLAWWTGQPIPELPNLSARLAMYLRHLDLYLAIAPERRAVVEMRKFAAWYFKGFPGAAALRKAIYHTDQVSQLRALVQRFGERAADRAGS